MKESSFGRYHGYTVPQYDGWQRRSRYLTMRDGVKVAIDIFLPTRAGELPDQPLPAIFRHHAGGRNVLVGDEAMPFAAGVPFAQHFLRHGYALVISDPRGTGASFGLHNYHDAVTIADAVEIIEWSARQVWCDGNIGMIGHSNSGNNAFMIGGQRPFHLKTIFPSMFNFDVYDSLFSNGIYRQPHVAWISDAFHWLDGQMPTLPVDDDPDGVLLAQATAQSRQEMDVRQLDQFPFRNSMADWGSYQSASPIGSLEAIVESDMPIYLWAGWFDFLVREVCLWSANLPQPHKLTIGPWHHFRPLSPDPEEQAALYQTEMLRWFDYWLKGIDNGIMEEPAINYATLRSPERWTWRQARSWPLTATQTHVFYFGAGRSGSVASVNDGSLSREQSAEGHDQYTVDYTTSSGKATRWDLTVAKMDYGDMTGNDEKGLTYTSDPLSNPLTVTGHPIVILYVATTATDGDFFVCLEDVTPTGFSHYVSDGCLRASHRAISEPSHNNLSLPYHRSFAEDILPVTPNEPVELRFDLLPISWHFQTGHQLRLTVTCADQNHLKTVTLTPPPIVTLFHHRSHILLSYSSPEKNG